MTFSTSSLWFWIVLFQAVSICVAGELRFCYNGPHRIQYKDCPGGFIAKKPLGATCLYYYRQEGSPLMTPIFSTNICETKRNMELDPDFYEFQDFHFQSIYYNDIRPDEGNTSIPDIAAPDKCNETCLADWLEPKFVDPEPIFVDKPDLAENDTADYKKDYIELTKRILLRIINEEKFDEDEDPDDPLAAFDRNLTKIPPPKKPPKVDFLGDTISTMPISGLMKLLAKSMRIIYKKCEPFVEGAFYSLVFRTMQEFRRLNEDLPNIHVLPLRRILNILDKCEKGNNNMFVLNGTECEDKYVLYAITNLLNNETEKYKPYANSFRWGRYDPIIEAAWNAVDFVHAYCFDYFITDMLHYSLYVKAMVEIFIQPLVEKHWMYPFPVGKGMTLWEMAYDTSDIVNQMRSLDACVVAAYDESVFEGRLERPFATEEQLKEPKMIPDPTIPSPGWKKGVDDYWRMYERQGFHEMVEEFGYCLQSEKEYDVAYGKVRMEMNCPFN